MPRRFFRKFAIKRHELAERWFMAPFRHMLHDTRLWGIRRKTVVPAFSLGLAISFMPFPGHALQAALLALALRVHIPVAVLTTFISNPVTVGPMYYYAYRLGATLLGIHPDPFVIEISWEWIQNVFLGIWLPLTLGCLLLASGAAIVGFATLDAFWRYTLHDYKSKKRNKRTK